jgi:hypothetical protein
MEFTSTVIYSRDHYIVVEVVGVDISPINIQRTKTNVMHYIFRNDEESKALPLVRTLLSLLISQPSGVS